MSDAGANKAIGVHSWFTRYGIDIQSVPLATFCPDRHPHLGVLAWIEGGAGAVFMCCRGQWWAWRISAGAAELVDRIRMGGASDVELMEAILQPPVNGSLWRMFRSRGRDGERDALRLGQALREWGAGLGA